MPNDSTATNHDKPRPAATGHDNDFILAIEEVSQRYARAGHPRMIRTLQRYCVSGHLDAQKIATATGDKYLVTPQSVARHIAQIQELAALDAVATGRDMPRQVGAEPIGIGPSNTSIEGAPLIDATDRVPSRQAATSGDGGLVYAKRLEREVEQAKDERDFLREQINRKDKTIEALIERDRETNFLIRGLQELIPRLGPGRDQPQEPLSGAHG